MVCPSKRSTKNRATEFVVLVCIEFAKRLNLKSKPLVTINPVYLLTAVAQSEHQRQSQYSMR